MPRGSRGKKPRVPTNPLSAAIKSISQDGWVEFHPEHCSSAFADGSPIFSTRDRFQINDAFFEGWLVSIKDPETYHCHSKELTGNTEESEYQCFFNGDFEKDALAIVPQTTKFHLVVRASELRDLSTGSSSGTAGEGRKIGNYYSCIDKAIKGEEVVSLKWVMPDTKDTVQTDTTKPTELDRTIKREPEDTIKLEPEDGIIPKVENDARS